MPSSRQASGILVVARRYTSRVLADGFFGGSAKIREKGKGIDQILCCRMDSRGRVFRCRGTCLQSWITDVVAVNASGLPQPEDGGPTGAGRFGPDLPKPASINNVLEHKQSFQEQT